MATPAVELALRDAGESIALVPKDGRTGGGRAEAEIEIWIVEAN